MQQRWRGGTRCRAAAVTLAGFMLGMSSAHATGLTGDAAVHPPAPATVLSMPATRESPERIEALAAAMRNSPWRRGRAFAIVDKPTATMQVYQPDGRLAGVTPVLLGRTVGDGIVPGTGERTAAGLLQDRDRTTPAGHFDSEPGRNLAGEAVVWLDYDSALAIHRLRSGAAEVTRRQRLASIHPTERRVSAGCVVAPVDFYDAVIEPLLGRGRAWVVVTPEHGDAVSASAPWARADAL
jgi:hypothetical protein